MSKTNESEILKNFYHVDSGFWSVVVNANKVCVESSDFRHDTRLEINGDFADIEDKKEYAQLLCDKLNRNDR